MLRHGIKKNTENLCCHGYTPILFLSISGQKYPNFNDFSNEKMRNCREPQIMGVGFHPKQTSQLESNILCLAITQFRGVSVARFIPCCHVQMSHFPEGKKSEKSLSTLGFYIFLSGELIFFILCIYHKEIMSFVFIEKKNFGALWSLRIT